MRLNLGCGGHPIAGFTNMDKDDGFGWRFEDGLPNDDGSVEAVAVSHSLMFVALGLWPFVFDEIERVLEPGGVVRITEDATDDPASERFGGHPDAVTLTSHSLVSAHLLEAGLAATSPLDPDQTTFKDRSLCQNLHGGRPKAFFIEGMKPT